MEVKTEAGARALVTRFYEALDAQDGETMGSFYDADATFWDPVFHSLTGAEPAAMWRMLTRRREPATPFSVRTGDFAVEEGESEWRVTGVWVANYVYEGRPVENHVQATIAVAKATGLFLHHRDEFDLHKWCSQALGLVGWLLGWTSFMQNKVHAQVRRSLSRFMEREMMKTDGRAAQL